MGLDELEALEQITSALPGPPAGQIWIGDDAAVVPGIEPSVLVGTDALVAGVHADLDLVGLDDFGWKAVVANVSDVAAMGGRPLYVVASVACGPDLDLERLYAGIAAACTEYGCPVVGGDLSASDQLVVSVAVVGTTGGEAAVLRSGAGPGDSIFLTRPLGASAAGLAALRHSDRSPDSRALVEAHRRPRARVREGAAARRGGATAMIDVSDGLGLDLGRLARASSVGVRLDSVPTAAGATAEEALGGGEDYELLFTAPTPAAVETAFREAGLDQPLRIGACSADPAERLLGSRPLPEAGWRHSL